MSLRFAKQIANRRRTGFRNEVCFASIRREFDKLAPTSHLWFGAKPNMPLAKWEVFKQVVNGIGFGKFIKEWDDDGRAAKLKCAGKIHTLQAYMVGSVFRMTTENGWQTDLLFKLHRDFSAPAIVKLYMCQVARMEPEDRVCPAPTTGGHNMMNYRILLLSGDSFETPRVAPPCAHPVELEKLRYARLGKPRGPLLSTSLSHFTNAGNDRGYFLSDQWWNHGVDLRSLTKRAMLALAKNHSMHEEWKALRLGQQTARDRFDGVQSRHWSDQDILKVMGFIARAMGYKTPVRRRRTPLDIYSREYGN